MKRTIDYFLLEWKKRETLKPLLLRGARQVGKTHAVRKLGKTFEHFVEINLELDLEARRIMDEDLNVDRILMQLNARFGDAIKPGATLLFIDEIQVVPQAIIALRYFYEKHPNLHVIAAGSLLDFAIAQVGMPVGRVTALYMYPMSFIEFLVALGNEHWAKMILNHSVSEPSSVVHNALLELVGIYIAVGGMPEAVKEWAATKATTAVKLVHTDLITFYRQDFGKYGRANQIKHLNLILNNALLQIGRRFVYSSLGDYQARELSPALELLEKAGILYQVMYSAGQGIPIGAQVDLKDFKIMFLDVGLSQTLMGFDIVPWFLDAKATFVNKGTITEAFVGQELLAYSDPIMRKELYYWRNKNKSTEAEIDYLTQLKQNIIPIEVKSGTGSRIQSLHRFLATHPNSPYGIRFSPLDYSIHGQVHSYPLYAVARPFVEANEGLYKALMSLVEEEPKKQPKL